MGGCYFSAGYAIQITVELLMMIEVGHFLCWSAKHPYFRQWRYRHF